MKIIFIFTLLFLSLALAAADSKTPDLKTITQKYHKCVAHHVLDLENKFADSLDLCETEVLNELKIKDLKIEKKILTKKEKSGQYTVSIQINTKKIKVKSEPDMALVGLGATDCHCLIPTSVITENEELAKTVIEDSAQACEIGAVKKDGVCRTVCDSGLVPGDRSVKKDGTYSFKCISCNEKYKENFNDVANSDKQLLELSKNLHSGIDGFGDCKREHECYLTDMWDPKIGRCRFWCSTGMTFSYENNVCVPEPDQCEQIRQWQLDNRKFTEPSWLNIFSHYGCNIKKYLQDLQKQSTDDIQATYEKCLKHPTDRSVFAPELADSLISYCAEELQYNKDEFRNLVDLPSEAFFIHYPKYPY